MTLSATPTLSDVVNELGGSFPYNFPTAESRWLAEVGVSDPIIFPTNFANKSSVKIVDSVTATNATSSQYTFTGVDFGAAFTGRVLIACIALGHSTNEITLDQFSCTIGGQSATGDDAGTSAAGGPSCGAGLWAAALDSGTSGNVFIDWTGPGGATNLSLVMLSVSGISVTPHGSSSNWNVGGTQKTTSLNIPSNGLLVVSHAHTNTNATSWTGVTERTEVNFGTFTHCVGFDNRMDSETGRTITGTWSGATAYGGEARSYQQG